MPPRPRRKAAKNLKKKIARKRKQNRKQTRPKVSASVGLGFPKRMTMTHKYFDNVTLSSAAGVISKNLFSYNSMFDPDATGSGHQPLYFDQMAALYNHYTVIGAKVTAIFIPKAAAEDAFWVGCWEDDDTTTTNITGITSLAEQTGAKYKIIPAGSTDPFTIVKKWSAKKTFGGSVLGNDNLQGTSTAGPTEQSYLGLAAMGVGTNTVDCTVSLIVEYIAVWEELKQVATS